jgi:hypothetical protein
MLSYDKIEFYVAAGGIYHVGDIDTKEEDQRYA